MTELAILFNPSLTPFLITTDTGTHAFSKVFYQDGAYNVDGGRGRLGPSTLLRAEVDPEKLVTRWSCGRVVEIPRSWFQLTYR